MTKPPKLNQKLFIVDWDHSILSGKVQEAVGKDRVWLNVKYKKEYVCDAWPLERIFEDKKEAAQFARSCIEKEISEHEFLLEKRKNIIAELRKKLTKL